MAAAASLPGCSIKARDMVSVKSLQAKIAAQLAATFSIAKPAVRCPSAVPAQAGSPFSCRTALYGQPLVVKGKVLGSRGQVEVKPADAVVATSQAEAMLADKLSGVFRQRAVVSCRLPPLLVAAPKRRFACTATLGKVKRQLVVTVTASSGALSYKVLPYRPGP